MALPPGAVKLENITQSGKPLLRLTVDKTVIVTRRLFMGDGNGAMEIEAIKEGMHFPSVKGQRGFVIDRSFVNELGSTLQVEGDFITVNQLKPGNVYVTTPSINFKFIKLGGKGDGNR